MLFLPRCVSPAALPPTLQLSCLPRREEPAELTTADTTPDCPLDSPVVWRPMSGVVSGISNLFDFSDATPDIARKKLKCIYVAHFRAHVAALLMF